MKRLALMFVLLCVVAMPAWAKEKSQPKDEASPATVEQTYCPADDDASDLQVVRAPRPPQQGHHSVQAQDDGCALCDFYWDLAIWADDPQLSLEYSVKSVGCSVKHNCY